MKRNYLPKLINEQLKHFKFSQKILKWKFTNIETFSIKPKYLLIFKTHVVHFPTDGVVGFFESHHSPWLLLAYLEPLVYVKDEGKNMVMLANTLSNVVLWTTLDL